MLNPILNKPKLSAMDIDAVLTKKKVEQEEVTVANGSTTDSAAPPATVPEPAPVEPEPEPSVIVWTGEPTVPTQLQDTVVQPTAMESTVVPAKPSFSLEDVTQEEEEEGNGGWNGDKDTVGEEAPIDNPTLAPDTVVEGTVASKEEEWGWGEQAGPEGTVAAPGPATKKDGKAD